MADGVIAFTAICQPRIAGQKLSPQSIRSQSDEQCRKVLRQHPDPQIVG